MTAKEFDAILAKDSYLKPRRSPSEADQQHRPTQEQYTILQGLKRLGADSESYENKIALCKDCHGTQDYHTTKDVLIRSKMGSRKYEIYHYKAS